MSGWWKWILTTYLQNQTARSILHTICVLPILIAGVDMLYILFHLSELKGLLSVILKSVIHDHLSFQNWKMVPRDEKEIHRRICSIKQLFEYFTQSGLSYFYYQDIFAHLCPFVETQGYVNVMLKSVICIISAEKNCSLNPSHQVSCHTSIRGNWYFYRSFPILTAQARECHP